MGVEASDSENTDGGVMAAAVMAVLEEAALAAALEEEREAPVGREGRVVEG